MQPTCGEAPATCPRLVRESLSLPRRRRNSGRVAGAWRSARRAAATDGIAPGCLPSAARLLRAGAARPSAARLDEAGCRARHGPAAAARRRPAARRSPPAHARACRARPFAQARAAAPSAPCCRREAAAASRCRSDHRGRASAAAPRRRSRSPGPVGGLQARRRLRRRFERARRVRSTASSICSAARRAARPSTLGIRPSNAHLHCMPKAKRPKAPDYLSKSPPVPKPEPAETSPRRRPEKKRGSTRRATATGRRRASRSISSATSGAGRPGEQLAAAPGRRRPRPTAICRRRRRPACRCPSAVRAARAPAP